MLMDPWGGDQYSAADKVALTIVIVTDLVDLSDLFVI